MAYLSVLRGRRVRRRGRARPGCLDRRGSGSVSRLAYAVLAYKLPRQLGRLVRALEPAKSPVLVHVDARTPPATYAAMRAELDGVSGVWWMRRHRCRWAGFGIVAAALDAVAAVAEGRVDADHLALLTAQDYPVKPAAQIREFLAGAPGTSFLSWQSVPPAG